jgi:hypothetical protein
VIVEMEKMKDIKEHKTFKLLLESVEKDSKDLEIKNIDRSKFKDIDYKFYHEYVPKDFPDLPPIPTKTEIDEGFVRFSAYRNDKRITPDGRLLPGAYTTTINDSRFVFCGLNAVARYALPNYWPAKYVFTIVPPHDIKIRIGTVKPNFSQSGGGIEAFFETGTPEHTVIGPYKTPER